MYPIKRCCYWHIVSWCFLHVQGAWNFGCRKWFEFPKAYLLSDFLEILLSLHENVWLTFHLESLSLGSSGGLSRTNNDKFQFCTSSSADRKQREETRSSEKKHQGLLDQYVFTYCLKKEIVCEGTLNSLVCFQIRSDIYSLSYYPLWIAFKYSEPLWFVYIFNLGSPIPFFICLFLVSFLYLCTNTERFANSWATNYSGLFEGKCRNTYIHEYAHT